MGFNSFYSLTHAQKLLLALSLSFLLVFVFGCECYSLFLASCRYDKLDVATESCVWFFGNALHTHNAFIFCQLNGAVSRVVTANLTNQNVVFIVETEATQMIHKLCMVENLD